MEKFPRCPDCGGDVVLTKGPGRTRERCRHVHLPVPDDYEIPTCVQCGEVSMSVEYSEPLDALLEERLIALIVAEKCPG